MKEKYRRFSWGEVSWGLHGPCIHLSQYSDPFEPHTLAIGLVFATFYIKVGPFIPKMGCMESGYGFSFTHDALHLMWDKETKCVWYPWSLEFHKREELVQGSSYARDKKAFVKIPRVLNYGQIATKQTADFTYTLRNGEVQKRSATFYVNRMEWRRRWLKWLPIFRCIEQSIWVEFDDEVGERAGSWKGGVMGCGYEMRPGESGLQALRRMERDRGL